jgi:putative flippase GtrA
VIEQQTPTGSDALAPPRPAAERPRHRDAWARTLQARRFVLVGILNTGVDYVLFVSLTKVLHLPLNLVWIAKLMSGTVALTISFFLNRSWVFGAKGDAGSRQALRFIATTTVSIYGIQTTLTQVIVNNFPEPGHALYHVARDVGLAQAIPTVVTQALTAKTAAFAIATLFSMTFNFLAYRYWVFRSPAPEPGAQPVS